MIQFDEYFSDGLKPPTSPVQKSRISNWIDLSFIIHEGKNPWKEAADRHISGLAKCTFHKNDKCHMSIKKKT